MKGGGFYSDAEDLATSVTQGPAWGAVILVCAELWSKFMALLPALLLFLGSSQSLGPPGTPLDHHVRAFEEDPILPPDLAQLSKYFCQKTM